MLNINESLLCIGCQEHVFSCLNSFHNSIRFTYKVKKQNQISFLDILIRHRRQKTETGGYRKSTNTDIYIHWNSYAPSSWNHSTLNMLITTAYTISSNDSYFKSELTYIRNGFHEQNEYLHWFITKLWIKCKG